jgi:hypothetical protein
MISLAGGARDTESRMSVEVARTRSWESGRGAGVVAAYQIDADRGPTGGPTSQPLKVWVLLVSAVSHQDQARWECRLAEPIMPPAGGGARWPEFRYWEDGSGPDLARHCNHECEHAAGFAPDYDSYERHSSGVLSTLSTPCNVDLGTYRAKL